MSCFLGVFCSVYTRACLKIHSRQRIVDPHSKSIEIYYLQDGQYVLQDSLMLEEDKKDEAYNAETVISLRAFPHVTMRLGELFENTL